MDEIRQNPHKKSSQNVRKHKTRLSDIRSFSLNHTMSSLDIAPVLKPSEYFTNSCDDPNKPLKTHINLLYDKKRKQEIKFHTNQIKTSDRNLNLNKICNEINEGLNFNSLKLVDGDCLEPSTNLKYNNQFLFKNIRSLTKRSEISGLKTLKNQRSSFFENDSDTPLLVSSINGLSNQVKLPVFKSEQSFLRHELIDGCDNQFSLLTPLSPMTKVKTKFNNAYSTKNPISFTNLSMTTCSTMRKRIKVASMKYLKFIPKKQNIEIQNDDKININKEAKKPKV